MYIGEGEIMLLFIDILSTPIYSIYFFVDLYTLFKWHISINLQCYPREMYEHVTISMYLSCHIFESCKISYMVIELWTG